eukprot:g1243.t1
MWVLTTNGGRFSNFVLPPGFDGKALLSLGARKLSSLYAGEHRVARGVGEGAAWTVAADNVNRGRPVPLVRGVMGNHAREPQSEERSIANGYFYDTGGEEGPDDGDIGRALFNAIRVEQQAAIAKRFGLFA